MHIEYIRNIYYRNTFSLFLFADRNLLKKMQQNAAKMQQKNASRFFFCEVTVKGCHFWTPFQTKRFFSHGK